MLLKRPVIILTLLFVILLFSACNKPSASTPTQTPGEYIQSPSAAAVETIAPTLPPQAATRVILWSPLGSNFMVKADLESALLSLVSDESLELITVENLTPADLTPTVKAVLALAPAEGLSTLAASAPTIQFLGVGIDGLVPTSNLSIIIPSENSLEQKAFMAGYLSVLITDDYRAGVLVQSGSVTGQTLSGSFFVGARYLCGLCNARFAPVEYYPKIAEVADPQSQTEWQYAVDLLRNQGVQTIFIQPELNTKPLMDYLNSVGVNIILLDSTPNIGPNTTNVALIKNDYQSALSELWPSLLENMGGKEIITGIALEPENDWISEGRLRLFYAVLDDLETGFIKPSPFNY